MSNVSPELRRDLFVTYMQHGAEGRSKLIQSFIQPARNLLHEAQINPTGHAGKLSEMACIMEEIIAKCDGTEKYDRVHVSGLIADMKSVAAQRKHIPYDPKDIEHLKVIREAIASV